MRLPCIFALLLLPVMASCARAKDDARRTMASNPSLAQSLRSWIEKGGDLRAMLSAATDQTLTSADEAHAVCAALDALRVRRDTIEHRSVRSDLHILTAFFQQAESESAVDVLRKEGLRRLRPWVHDALIGRGTDDDSVMFVLKILAMYQQREDAELIAEAARKPFKPDDFMWSVVLGNFNAEHPHAAVVVDALRDPLPSGFLLVSYLDMSNALATAGKLDRHPFAADPGLVQLERWLRDNNEEHFSYAVSATAALPFIPKAARTALLRVAANHRDPVVRMESAWAEAKSGDPAGFERLVALCLDPRQSYTAQRYLEELGAKTRIPVSATKPDFRAIAEMANWLAHPSEFGRQPHQIELFDTRELRWPPTNDRRRLWLVKYTYNDGEDGKPDIGVGLVGSVTFALFGETTADLSPEDIYALHCCWELEVNEDPRAPEKRSVRAGREILRKWNKGF